MKRLLFALVGYALYRWITQEPAAPTPKPASARRSPPRRPATD